MVWMDARPYSTAPAATTSSWAAARLVEALEAPEAPEVEWAAPAAAAPAAAPAAAGAITRRRLDVSPSTNHRVRTGGRLRARGRVIVRPKRKARWMVSSG